MKKIILLFFIFTNILFASIGQITALVGDIKISRDSKEIQAKLGEKLEKNDVINSSKASKAQITLDDNTIITIGQNSSLNIFDYAFDETKPQDSKASFGFMKGSFKSITGKIGKINKERFKLKTKSASIGIRGTTIVGNQRMIACTDGAISVSANGVTVNVGKQEFTQTPEGAAPTPAQTLTPETLDTLEKESNGGDTGGNTEGGDGSGNDDEGNDNGGGNDDGGNANDGGGGITPPDVDVEVPDTNDDDKKNTITTATTGTTTTSTSSIDGFTYKGYVAAANYVNSSASSRTLGKIGLETDGETISSYKIIDFSDNSSFSNGTITLNFNSTNEMAWGFWNSLDYTTSNKTDGYKGVWVTGVETATSVVQALIDEHSQTLNFSGNVIGGYATYQGTNYTTLSGNVTLAFNFGGGNNSFSGGIVVSFGSNNPSITMTIGNGTITSTGFSSTNITNQTNGSNYGFNSGEVKGSFYGTGSIKAIGGNFKFKGSGSDEAVGVFQSSLSQCNDC